MLQVIAGMSPGFGRGGPRNFFFRFGNLHVAKRHAAHGEAMRFNRGVRGHSPPRNFFRTVQFGAFWCIFWSDLVLKNFNNYHFLYKNFKNCNFLYKRINILDTRLLWGNYSRGEIVRKIYDWCVWYVFWNNIE